MKKAVTLMLCIVIASSFISIMPIAVMADKGLAKAYIISLSGVSGMDDSGTIDLSKVVQGAQSALEPNENSRVPRVHPKYGKSPPFYNVNYEVVSNWATYKMIIESYTEVVVINTHGRITPIPSGYSPDQWADKIADAMLNRRLTWVHTAGYPFSNFWNQVSGLGSWGEAGFQRLMSHINKGDVNCYPHGSPTEQVPLTNAALGTILNSWSETPFKVEVGSPIKAADFGEHLVLPIYGDEYYTGAIIAFAKPGHRFLPYSSYGFGAYVHIGAGRTYTEAGNPTDRDFLRGYLGAAASVFTEMQAFNIRGMNAGSLDVYPFAEQAISCTPVISSYNYLHNDDSWRIRLSFPVYGSIKIQKGTYTYIDDVAVYLGDIPSDCTLEMQTALSKEGENAGLLLKDVNTGNAGKLIGNTLLFFLALAPPLIGYPATVLGGVMLYSDWLRLPASGRGVDYPDSVVDFSYSPRVTETDPDDGYLYDEFESIITVELKVPKTGRKQWRVITLDWEIGIHTYPLGEQIPFAKGGISIAVFNPPDPDVPFLATVFFEDFEDDMNGWSVDDQDGYGDLDYWGRSTSLLDACDAWCAHVGDNSIYGMSNQEVAKYDKSMDTYLMRPVDLRPYQSAQLCYEIGYFTKTGDYATAEYYSGGAWHELNRYSGRGVIPEAYSIPISTSYIKFNFVSNNDNDVDLGVFIDNVEIRAVIPNDAINQNIDAGDTFAEATPISVSSSSQNYAGYLNDEDWYEFYVDYLDTICVSLHSPAGADFDVELYDIFGRLRAGPANGIAFCTMPNDPVGIWAINISSRSGFGQYDFDIAVYFSGTACPYVSTWNGTQYVLDNNLLPRSESIEGDVTDFYMLQKRLAQNVQGSYSLLISEFENEHDFFDQVRLLGVDHESNTNVAVSPNGDILTYTHPYPAVSAVTNENRNVKELLNQIDGNYYQGYNGSDITLNFGDLDVSQGAKLVLRADPDPGFPRKLSIHVQVQDADGDWNTVSVVTPRIYWATEIVDMSRHLPDAKGRLKVRLQFTANHRLDFVGLDASPHALINVQEGQLTAAFHSASGDVVSLLFYSDQTRVELLPGEHIELVFTLPPQLMETRNYIIVVKGHYHTINS